MNAEQKKRIAHEISNWKNACNCRAVQLAGDRMAAMLNELLAATNPAQISSLAEPQPPAPSVPDGWMRAIDEAMVIHHLGIADRADSYEVAKKKLNALLAINSDIARDCSEAPADLVRDAERWQMLPAFLAEFQVPYLQLVDKIDAAIEREILRGEES